jgi:hypothetical protein
MPVAIADAAAWKVVITDGASSVIGLYKSIILGEGPIAYFRLDDTGTTAADATGNGNTGTLSGGVTTGVAGAITDGDAAMSFDGASGYVSVPGTPLGTAGPFTVEAWAKAISLNHSGGAGLATIFEKGNSLGDEFRAYVDSTGTLTVRFTDANGVLQTATSGGGLIAVGSWYHYVQRWDGAHLQSYVNGALAATAPLSTGPAPADTRPLYIGQAYVTNRFWDGPIDEVALYPTALSATQIKNHYLAGLEKIAARLVIGDKAA